MALLRPAGLAALARALAPHVVAASIAGLPIVVFGAALGSGLAGLTERRPSSQASPRVVTAAPAPRHTAPRRPAEPPPPPPVSIDPGAALLWQVYEGWCAPLAAAVCQIAEGCCMRPPPGCVDDAYAACTAMVEQVTEARDLERLRFDTRLVRACLARIDLGRPGCTALEPYSAGGDCPAPLVVRDEPGVCVLDPIGACSADGCRESCRPRALPGEAGDESCWPGHVDVGGTCQRLPRLGEPCDDLCEPGLWCTDGRCIEPARLGERCAVRDDCARGLRCESSRCRPEPRACAVGSDCGADHLCLANEDGRALAYRILCGTRRGCPRREPIGTCAPEICEPGRVLSLFGGRAGEPLTP